MRTATFDLSYRSAPSISVVLYPDHNDLRRWLKTLQRSPQRPMPRARWVLRSSGLIWFGDAYTMIHMDDSQGSLLPPPGDSQVRDSLRRDAPLVIGDLRPQADGAWRIRAKMAWEDDYYLRQDDVRALLGCFPAWRRVVAGSTPIQWDLP